MRMRARAHHDHHQLNEHVHRHNGGDDDDEHHHQWWPKTAAAGTTAAAAGMGLQSGLRSNG